MALGTYQDLRTSVAAWLMRDDMAAVIPDLITLAETRLNSILRVGEMETRTFLDLSDVGEANLPADFLESRFVVLYPGGLNIITDDDGNIIREDSGAVWTDGDTAGAPRNVLRRVALAWAADYYNGTNAGRQDEYTILENTFTAYAARAASVVLYYYRKIPALSDDEPTNWL